MNCIPDSLLVWSDLMADEAVLYHKYPREQIQWCGAAQFDHYHEIRKRFDRMAWRNAHGIQENVGLVVYGTINPALIPHELEILESIVLDIQAGRFVRPLHLWIRLHPQVVRGIYSQTLEPYRALARRCPNITLEEPSVISEKLAWDLPRNDADHLSMLLAAADVVVTTSSTLSIDAACAGTPIVNIFYDGCIRVHPASSAKRFMYYTHYEKILQTGGISSAKNAKEFVSMVNSYLENPSLHQIGRDEMIRQQMNRLDGKSGIRTANKLLQLAGTQTKR
jgi:hypothetical protein